MARAQATTNHEVIRHWIEAHNGHPSVVRATEGTRKGSAGLLRVDFDEPEDSLEEISWDDFFDTFDSQKLAFLYQDEEQSRFHKFVDRDSVDASSSDDTGEGQSSTRGRSKSASGDGSSKSSGKVRQASPAEEEEIEEIDAEEIEDDESDEDIDEDIDETDEDEDEDDDTPRRGRKR